MVLPSQSIFLKFTAVSSEPKSKLCFPVGFFFPLPKTNCPLQRTFSLKTPHSFPLDTIFNQGLFFWNIVKLPFFVSIFHLYVYIWACSHAHMCACVSKAWGDIRYLPWQLSTLCFEIGSHLAPRAHQLWLAIFWGDAILPSRKTTGITGRVSATHTKPYVVSRDLDSLFLISQ